MLPYLPLITILVTFLTGFLGIYYGYQSFKIQRRFNFRERQLNELYSPILGCIKEIRAKSTIRHKIMTSASELRRNEIREWNEAGRPREYKPEINIVNTMIDYNNNQFFIDN
jgi:ABC-type siderophore export system fused ATPase/permease subunit